MRVSRACLCSPRQTVVSSNPQHIIKMKNVTYVTVTYVTWPHGHVSPMRHRILHEADDLKTTTHNDTPPKYYCIKKHAFDGEGVGPTARARS